MSSWPSVSDLAAAPRHSAPSNPFVSPIERIVASDDEIRDALEEAEVPPLLPSLACLTGDLTLLRDEPATGPPPERAPTGWAHPRAAACRAGRSRSTRSRHSATQGRGRADAVGRRPAAHHGVRSGRYGNGRVPAAARGGARAAGRGPARADVAQGRHRTRSRPARRRDRRRNVGTVDRAPVAAGGRVVRRAREGRRRGRHLVREHVSGVPRRQPQPQLQLLLRGAARLATALLDAGRAARLFPPLLTGVRAPRPHSLRHRGSLRDVVRRRQGVGRPNPHRRGRRRDDHGRRRHQRGRPAQPPELPEHPGA